MEYKEFGFDLFAIMMEKRKKHQLSKSEACREAIREIKKCLATESKYFSYLSGLTVKELRDIARESGLYEYTALRKANLIRFLDRQSRVIKKCVEKQMFPDAMKAWVELFAPNEFDLVKFLVRHRYIFSDDFYKQRSLPNQIRAWVELFADDNFAEHYTEVMLNTLTKSGYYKPTNQIEYYCWWKGLPLANDNERNLFLSKPNSFIVFEREMDVRFREMILNAGGSVRERFMQSACTQFVRNKWRL